MVYTKQLEMKRKSQRRIRDFIFHRPYHWASWTELLNAKRIGLSKRALSRNLREMLKAESEYALTRMKRPFNPYILQDLHVGRGIFKGILKKKADLIKKSMMDRAAPYLEAFHQLDLKLKRGLITEEEHRTKRSQIQGAVIANMDRIIGKETLHLRGKTRERTITFYRKKQLRKALKKVDSDFKGPHSWGYSVRQLDPTDESLFHVK